MLLCYGLLKDVLKDKIFRIFSDNNNLLAYVAAVKRLPVLRHSVIVCYKAIDIQLTQFI